MSKRISPALIPMWSAKPSDMPKSILSAAKTTSSRRSIAAAVKGYDKFIVCLEKSPEEFETAMKSLMEKAINAYENRAPGMRHGLALDKQVTIILSQSDTARPLCGIYFNLHSPYQKNALPSTVKAVEKKASSDKED